MVLRTLALAALACGCRQSLFDAHGEASDAGGDAAAGATCQAPCLGDSGGDFDGTANGKTGRWRYLEDHRDRTWAPMTAMDNGFIGADPANRIVHCQANSSAKACQALAGALLVSTAGISTPSDPAIEFTAEAHRTIELHLDVHVPAGGFGQTVRLYRNSREDVLFTGIAEPGVTLTHAITLDALAGDRFLVAIAPPALGQADIGIRLHAVGANTTFPTECQLAVSFSTLTGLMTDDACKGAKLTAMRDSTPGTPAPALGPGPFPELGQAANIAEHNFYKAPNVLDRPGDVTIDLWVKHAMLIDPATIARVYSEENRNSTGGGGLTITITGDQSKLKIWAETIYTGLGMFTYVGPGADYPIDQAWHFIRAVHKADGAIKLCVDGVFKGMKNASGTLKPTSTPYIGQYAYEPDQPATFIGSIDDVRVLNTALPCE